MFFNFVATVINVSTDIMALKTRESNRTEIENFRSSILESSKTFLMF